MQGTMYTYTLTTGGNSAQPIHLLLCLGGTQKSWIKIRSGGEHPCTITWFQTVTWWCRHGAWLPLSLSDNQVSNWFANARRRLKNTVRQPDLSWALRIKLYNKYVQGNAERLSISSDDSCSEGVDTHTHLHTHYFLPLLPHACSLGRSTFLDIFLKPLDFVQTFGHQTAWLI